MREKASYDPRTRFGGGVPCCFESEDWRGVNFSSFYQGGDWTFLPKISRVWFLFEFISLLTELCVASTIGIHRWYRNGWWGTECRQGTFTRTSLCGFCIIWWFIIFVAFACLEFLKKDPCVLTGSVRFIGTIKDLKFSEFQWWQMSRLGKCSTKKSVVFFWGGGSSFFLYTLRIFCLFHILGFKGATWRIIVKNDISSWK